jgi:hypothetical protein
MRYRLTRAIGTYNGGEEFVVLYHSPTTLVGDFGDGNRWAIPRGDAVSVEEPIHGWREEPNKPTKSLEEIEEELLSKPLLKFNRIGDLDLDLKDFIILFFVGLNKYFTTVEVESGNLRTNRNKRRSIGDVYRIVKHYYPEVTLPELFTKMDNIFGREEGFRSSYCTTINKRVYYYSRLDGSIVNLTTRDEYGLTYDDWRRLANG